MWTDLEEKLVEWESRFLKVNSDEDFDLDKEYLLREIESVKEEKKLMEYRLRKLDEIIAKTKVLIDDLSEDLCHKLSKGRSIATVAEAVKREFGNDFEADLNEGRKEIVKFLEKHYDIDKKSARQIFDLLEETGVVYYELSVPAKGKHEKIDFVPLEADFDFAEPVYAFPGYWVINA